MTQREHIWNILKSGRGLTHIDCLNEVGTTELRSRISELEKLYSIKISRETVKSNGKHFNRYYLTNAQIESLNPKEPTLFNNF